MGESTTNTAQKDEKGMFSTLTKLSVSRNKGARSSFSKRGGIDIFRELLSLIL